MNSKLISALWGGPLRRTALSSNRPGALMTCPVFVHTKASRLIGYPMNAGRPHERKLCGARTRRGTACRRWACPNGRCANHGGKSRAWFAHSRYKHGHSKYGIERIKWLEQRQAIAFWRDVERRLARLPGEAVTDEQLSAVRRELARRA